jgi:hypothetical protein
MSEAIRAVAPKECRDGHKIIEGRLSDVLRALNGALKRRLGLVHPGPGYVRPFRYTFVLALGYFAVSRETALAVSVAALLGPVTVLGFAFLWRESVRTGQPPDLVEPELEKERVG